MLICLMTGNVNLHHWLRQCLHCEVSIFRYIVNKSLREHALTIRKYSVSSQTFIHCFYLLVGIICNNYFCAILISIIYLLIENL